MIKIITGKGGVGKTTSCAMYALSQSLRNQETSLLSIDPMHSITDAYCLRNNLPANKWTNLWDLKPWKELKAEHEALRLMEAVPTGNHLPKIRDAVMNGLYTEYEVIAGEQALRNHENLIIDTDSLEGLQRLLNYFSETGMNAEYEIIPVTTLESASLTKLNNALFQPVINEQEIKTLIINRARGRNDPRMEELNYYINLIGLEKIILYEQNEEPVGINLLKLDTPQQLITQENNFIESARMPQHKTYFICGKGGQGKTTISTSMALKLSENNDTYLMSADARTSIPDILGINIPEMNEGESAWHQVPGTRLHVMKENPYWDNVPGIPMMKALMLAAKHYYTDSNLVIDCPPSGNILKSFNKGLPNDDWVQELIYKIDLYQLKKRGQQGVHKFMTDRRHAFTEGLKALMTPDCIAIPVTTTTTTAINETNKLISELYCLGIYPYNIMYENTHYIEGNNQEYHFKKPIVINKAEGDIRWLEDEYPRPDYEPIIVPKQTREPTGINRLREIGNILYQP